MIVIVDGPGTGPCVFGKLFLNAPGRKYVLAVWQLEK